MMTSYYATSILAIVTAILLLIFSFFLVVQKKRRNRCSIILTAFLISNAIYLAGFALSVFMEPVVASVSWFLGIGSAFGFLFGPLLYLFTLSITNRKFHFRQRMLMHFVLFVIVVLLIISRVNIFLDFFHILLIVQVSIYLLLCLVHIRNYRNDLRECYSSVDRINLTWLMYVVGGFFLMWMIDLAGLIYYRSGGENNSLILFLSFLSIAINFVFAIWVFYNALHQPDFLFGVLEELEITKYKNSRLSQQEKKDILVKVKTYFEEEQPFLHSSLMIREVSSAINIPSKYISQVINESLNKNFYDFVNTYRLRYAMNELLEHKEKTILEVLYASGFNTKSAFNSAFKRLNGITPSEYRRRHNDTTPVVKPGLINSLDTEI
jgi:AraC-like DNA-binding protein